MEEQEKKIIKIKIFGTIYTLKTDSDEEYVKKIADTINERMNAISSKNPDLPSFKTAMLCLIEIADEMIKIRKKLDEIENDLSERTSTLIKKIEERLSSDYTII